MQLKTVISDSLDNKLSQLIHNYQILEDIYKNALQPIFDNI